jgi:hypothetical protein
MIEKQEFYHGAAILRVVSDAACESVYKTECGFLINDQVLVYLKYRTKSRTPWTFVFAKEETIQLNVAESKYAKVVIGLICGGDGVCGLPWSPARDLLADQAGWISCARRFNEQYGVSGSAGTLRRKVSLQQWPGVIFE